MLGDFTEKWTTAAAGQIEKLMAAAPSAEREACATIVEREAETGGSTAQIAAKGSSAITSFSAAANRRRSGDQLMLPCPETHAPRVAPARTPGIGTRQGKMR